MKKRFTLFALNLVFFTAGNAQYVTIPDSSFREYLRGIYPACFNGGGLLDSTCGSIVNEDTLYVLAPAGEFTDLTGLHYFKNLKCLNYSGNAQNLATEIPGTLTSFYYGGNNFDSAFRFPPGLQHFSCANSGLDSLPALPEDLKYLNVSMCVRLKAIPPLPASLEYLNCTYDQSLISFPALTSKLRYVDMFYGPRVGDISPLPDSLRYLNCSYTSATNLGVLPAHLDTLICFNDFLQSLGSLPPSLKFLDCSGNRLSSLEALPAGLIELICSYNPLGQIPALPASLTSLNCSATGISNLPVLNNALKILDCSFNPLYHLPALPPTLKTLRCTDDSLIELTSLPAGLLTLVCDNNQLTELPVLPVSLTTLSLKKNNIFCLPRIKTTGYLKLYIDAEKINCIPSVNPLLLITRYNESGQQVYTTLKLCSPVNNSHHCEAFPVITGTIFYDNNANGIKENGELGKAGIKIAASSGEFTYTDESGNYESGSDTLGAFSVSAQDLPSFFNAEPSVHNFNFTSYDTIVYNNNFALQANASVDSLLVTVMPVVWAARPGFPFPYFIKYENSGTTTLPAVFSFDYDAVHLTYDSGSVSGLTDNNGILTFNAGNIVPGQAESFYLYFTVKTGAPLGDSVNATAQLTAGAYSAIATSSTAISGSFDPNDKQATPQLSPSQVANGDFIDYTIRFQNTGTDTAFTVVISDTLNHDLHTNSLQMIASSHNCKTTVKDNIVFFEFRNILLPDSNVNEPKSHGFVSFRIKPKTTVAANTVIPNKAAIYFDYNAPVITNTAGTLIKDFTVVPLKLISFGAVPQNNNTISLYWNTSNEINTKHFAVERGVDGLHYNFIATVFAKGKANNHYNAVVTDANTGIVFYRLKIVDTDGSFTYSPVIKIDKRKNTTGIHILSNPVKDVIVISTTDRTMHNTQASIINMQGAVVKTCIMKGGSQTIDLGGLPPGMYYIRTTRGNEKFLLR